MNYVLDSFAILAYLGDEEGADKVEELLDKAEVREAEVFVNYVNLGEVYYIVARELGTSKANEAVATVKTWPVTFEEVNECIALSAARVKAEHSLAYADAFVVATAIDKKGTIVTGDEEFEGVYPHILRIR